MTLKSLRTFTVLPHLPPRLAALHKLAYNLWWCWNHEAVSLFRRVDDALFETVENSPVKLLGAIDQSRLEQLQRDDGFLAHLDRVEEDLNRYLAAPTWFQETYSDLFSGDKPVEEHCRIAYFSAEFGIHESIPIYSGGLGLLAGDHLKAASDLGIPLVGVGLLASFTTFSTLVAQTYRALDDAQYVTALVLPALSLLARLAMLAAGVALGRLTAG